MRDKIIIWTPNLPDGYGAFDEEDIIEEINTDDDENI